MWFVLVILALYRRQWLICLSEFLFLECFFGCQRWRTLAVLYCFSFGICECRRKMSGSWLLQHLFCPNVRLGLLTVNIRTAIALRLWNITFLERSSWVWWSSQQRLLMGYTSGRGRFHLRLFSFLKSLRCLYWGYLTWCDGQIRLILFNLWERIISRWWSHA